MGWLRWIAKKYDCSTAEAIRRAVLSFRSRHRHGLAAKHLVSHRTTSLSIESGVAEMLDTLGASCIPRPNRSETLALVIEQVADIEWGGGMV